MYFVLSAVYAGYCSEGQIVVLMAAFLESKAADAFARARTHTHILTRVRSPVFSGPQANEYRARMPQT